MNRYECDVFHNTVGDVTSALAEIGKSSLAAMVDTFHANIEERSQREAIHSGGSAIRHGHLSETNRGLFGTGHLNLHEVFGALSDIAYRGTCSFGVYRDAPAFAGESSAFLQHPDQCTEGLSQWLDFGRFC